MMMMMSLLVPTAQVFFLIPGHAFHLAEERRARTRIGLVREEALDDGGGGRRRNITENPQVQ